MTKMNNYSVDFCYKLKKSQQLDTQIGKKKDNGQKLLKVRKQLILDGRTKRSKIGIKK